MSPIPIFVRLLLTALLLVLAGCGESELTESGGRKDKTEDVSGYRNKNGKWVQPYKRRQAR